jgi:hypothetical protein
VGSTNKCLIPEALIGTENAPQNHHSNLDGRTNNTGPLAMI